MSAEERWIARNGRAIYHVDPDCRAFPDDVRRVNEEDERRQLRACNLCGPAPARQLQKMEAHEL